MDTGNILLIVLAVIFGGSALAVTLIIAFSGRGDANCLPEAIVTIEENLRGLPFLAHYVLDGNGQIILYQAPGSQAAIEFSADQIQQLQSHPGSISILNHLADTPPSFSDLAFAACAAEAYLIVVCPTRRYIIGPAPTGWKDQSALEQIFANHPEPTDAAFAAVMKELGYSYHQDVLPALRPTAKPPL